VKSSAKSNLVLGFVFFLIIVLDQASKFLVSLKFQFICNYNGPFGVVGNFSAISIFILILIGFLILREEDKYLRLAYAGILAAGISNLVDRLVLGCVRDFINLGFWPAFNFADSIITVCVLAIVYKLGKGLIR